jgi:Cdc6-like AAA superfamily ATPase
MINTNTDITNEKDTKKDSTPLPKDIYGILKPFLKKHPLDFTEAEALIYDLTYILKKKYINEKETQRILKAFQNIKTLDHDFIRSLVHDIYDETVPLTGTEGSHGIIKLLTRKEVPMDTAVHIKESIINEILDDEEKGSIHCPLGDDEAALVSPITKEIHHLQIKKLNGKDFSKKKTVISAYPKEITIYDSPIAGEPRRFKINFNTRTGKTFTEGPALISDIIQNLIESGYVLSPMHVKSVLPAVVTHYNYEGIAKVMDEIDYPGFFYQEQDKKIITVQYDYHPPTREELIDAVNLLDELILHFKNEEDKLATCLKWGLIAPFSYIKKQLGPWLPWLYLYGTAGSGKTTIAKIMLYLYSEPSQDNDLGGSSFDTVARVGNRLSQSTFPIVVNEPKGAFDRSSVVEMFKTAVERTVGRGKYEGRSYTNIPAFAPVAFTSNHFIPTDDALLRRMNSVNFTHKERKTPSEKKEFDEKFQVDNTKHSPLHKLKALGYFFATELYYDPEILVEDWKEITNRLLTRLYMDLDRQVPEWLLGWNKIESLEDLDEDQKEDIRIFILDEINRVSRTVRWKDEEDRSISESLTNYTTDKIDFKEKLEQIITSNLIPWMIMVNTKDTDYVCFTSGFKKVVHKNTEVCMSLKSIGELLGWKHMTEKKLSTPKKVVRVSFADLLDFLYI